MLLPGIVLAVLIVVGMGNRRVGDFYALHVYPAVSSVLSLIASLDKAQTWVYDLFLKGNNISSGMKNYSESVGLLISVDYTD